MLIVKERINLPSRGAQGPGFDVGIFGNSRRIRINLFGNSRIHLGLFWGAADPHKDLAGLLWEGGEVGWTPAHKEGDGEWWVHQPQFDSAYKPHSNEHACFLVTREFSKQVGSKKHENNIICFIEGQRSCAGNRGSCMCGLSYHCLIMLQLSPDFP